MATQNHNQGDRSQDAWKRSLLDARERAREALAECSGPHVETWQAINTGEVVQYLHAETLDYYRHLAPKSAEFPDNLWKETLVEVNVPKTQRLRAGMTDWYGGYDTNDILDRAEWAAKPVTLDNLRDEWLANATASIEIIVDHRSTDDQDREYRQYELHLPPAASEAVIAQLDECLEYIGWLPTTTASTYHADPEEALTHK